MMKEVVKVKFKKLKKYSLAGNYLYFFKNKYYFADRIYNSLFLNTEKPTKKSELKNEFENYLTEFFTACSQMKNKPSFYVLSNEANKEKYLEALGETYVEATTKKHVVLLEKAPSIYFSNDDKFFKSWIEKTIKKRTDVLSPNNIFIVIDKPETFDLEKIETYLTLVRSRKLHYILFVHNKKAFESKFAPEVLDIIYALCPVKFTCNNDEIESIEVNSNKIVK